MFIKNCLTPIRELTLLKSGSLIGEALDRMKEVNVFSLPVVDQEGNFIGILSKQSMFDYLEKNADQLSFSEFRNKPINECIDESAKLFVDIEKGHFEDLLPIIVRHPFVPIVEEGKQFIGIVKRSAIQRALESSFGLHVPGVRLMIAVDDTEGTLLGISQIIYKHDVNIIASVAFEAGDSFVRRIMMKLEKNEVMDKILRELDAHGYRVLEVSYDEE